MSCEPIRSLMSHDVKFQRLMKKQLQSQKDVKDEAKFGPRLGERNFFGRQFFLNTFFYQLYLVYSKLIDLSGGSLNT